MWSWRSERRVHDHRRAVPGRVQRRRDRVPSAARTPPGRRDGRAVRRLPGLLRGDVVSALAAVEPLDEFAAFTAATKKGRRGGDRRGSSSSRRAQREYLVRTYRADVDVYDVEIGGRIVRLEIDARE